ncbi:hypothetical protein PRIPAC_90037, partial [Pristionchus pacificus]|uniref:Uncharacterized protein n=1 Tax=Pristionchus pacificus TaxID=54126 RepID=A0A2A6B3S4_PRIPA
KVDKYEAVRDRIEQGLAQSKNVNSLKLCVLGFLRVLMTMGIFVLAAEASLAPDDVNPSREEGERAWGIERAQRLGRGHEGETRVDQKIGSQQGRDCQIYLQARELTFLPCARPVSDMSDSIANGLICCLFKHSIASLAHIVSTDFE